MFRPRIYVDTSVIGGCLDDEFKDYSKLLFKEFSSGKKRIVVSDLVLFELEGAPEDVKDVLHGIPQGSIEYVFLNEESLSLAGTYLKEDVIAENSIADARHIAIATIERVDVLVSWNFKHIVNLNRIRRFNAVNLKLGYPTIEIRSPSEVLNEN